jgi:hypothetical protein
MYGARVDASGAMTHPVRNAAVESFFGTRTDAMPGGFHVSPRFGINWTYGKPDSRMPGVEVSALGSAFRESRGMIRGGIGEFRDALPAALLSQTADGVSKRVRELSCIGGDTPTPDWTAYAADIAAIPTACASGVQSIALGRPAIAFFDKHYEPPRSWRANLAWTTNWSRFDLTLEGIASLNLKQPQFTDLNFAGATAFALADENNRPVYVSAAEIVPQNGLLLPTTARRTSEFGPVISQGSGGRSLTRQGRITLTPDLSLSRYLLSLSYVATRTQRRQVGFSTTTAGDPRIWENVPGDLAPRHQVTLSAGIRLPKGLVLTLFGRVESGQVFTPLVDRDINGDGFANDRAFVFSPTTPLDTSAGREMESLLAHASSSVKDCLSGQVGHIASAASCAGPWTTRLNARLDLNTAFLTGHRTRIALNIANPLGGLDQLLHGANSLHGWGGSLPPDPVLLVVRGFDPAKQRFLYRVNPRFGTASPLAATLRSPFRISVDVSIDLAPPLPEQQLDRALRPGRAGRPGPRLTAKEIETTYARTVPNPFTLVLRESDSLFLSPTQIDSLRAEEATLNSETDPLWEHLGQELATAGDSYDAGDELHQIDIATKRAWQATWERGLILNQLLTPIQRRLLPDLILSVINAPRPPDYRLIVY